MEKALRSEIPPREFLSWTLDHLCFSPEVAWPCPLQKLQEDILGVSPPPKLLPSWILWLPPLSHPYPPRTLWLFSALHPTATPFLPVLVRSSVASLTTQQLRMNLSFFPVHPKLLPRPKLNGSQHYVVRLPDFHHLLSPTGTRLLSLSVPQSPIPCQNPQYILCNLKFSAQWQVGQGGRVGRPTNSGCPAPPPPHGCSILAHSAAILDILFTTCSKLPTGSAAETLTRSTTEPFPQGARGSGAQGKTRNIQRTDITMGTIFKTTDPWQPFPP